MIVDRANWEDTQCDILDRFNAGEKIASLAREYGITSNLMSAHIEKFRERRKLIEENELYSSMHYSEVKVSEKMAKRIINSLNRYNITTIDALKKLSLNELLNMWNIGTKQVEIMRAIGWINTNEDDSKKKKIQIVVPIPTNNRIVTNGDMVEAVFPNLVIVQENGCVGIERSNDSTHIWIDRKWWNAPYYYEKEKEDE